MKFEMVMPKMGESITEGTIIKWLKSVGDTVEADEIILEISTDKVDSEIPTPAAGKIIELLAGENDTVDVGVPIAIIETDGTVPIEQKTEEKVPAESSKEPVIAEEISAAVRKPVSKPAGNRFYSPVVMNIAAQNSIAMEVLESIPGSGANGRLTKKDLLAYLDKGPSSAHTPLIPAGLTISRDSSAEPVETLPMDNMRKRIAEHMVHSKQTSAHVSLYTEVDMHHIDQIRQSNKEAFKAREGFSLTYMPFIVEATVQALKEFPMLNAQIDGDNILIKKYYHIGIAVAVGNGLIVPNVYHCEERNLTGLARAVNDVALRARTKKLKPDELAGGTFSISNFGIYGTTVGFPIINQPQVAILGVGAVKKRPVVINDAIAIRPIMYLSLTIDHRLIDGAMGSQFLQRIAGLLENYELNIKL